MKGQFPEADSLVTVSPVIGLYVIVSNRSLEVEQDCSYEVEQDCSYEVEQDCSFEVEQD